MEQVQLQEDIMAIVSLLSSYRGNQSMSNLLIEPEEVDSNSSNALFGSSESQKVLDRTMKQLFRGNNAINSSSTISTESDPSLITVPVVEVNVGVGSITDALT